ncbi:MAG: hypothetical protein NW226_18695 [Microscillaceae bacterium]|nr:hypothetical protein [Microscillaceae bacterium]
MSIVQTKVFAPEITPSYERVISLIQENNTLLDLIIQQNKTREFYSKQLEQILTDLRSSNVSYEQRINTWYSQYIQFNSIKEVFFKEEKKFYIKRIEQALDFFLRQQRQIQLTKSAIAE